VVAGALGYGWFEAGWVRLCTLELPLDTLPEELDGVRIAHLSDFHLGTPSRGARATARAIEWVAERQPDVICITGDLLARRRGLPLLERLLRELPAEPYVVLGNHDFAISRDPFSEPAQLAELPRGTLLADDSVEVELRGVHVEVAGVDPRSWIAKRPSGFDPSDAPFRLLLCHFPGALTRVEPDRWHLILAGHLHAGQIVLPYGRSRRLLLAHPGAPFRNGVFRRGRTAMHVSSGLGTTFVPFRFFARPEATELVLRSTT
jgi:predicted MPP superfamily phosphohydrolase